MAEGRSLLRLLRLRGHILAQSGTQVARRFPQTAACSGTRNISVAAKKVLDTRRQVKVLDSYMSFLDTAVGDSVVVFLHGNPTSAFLWRNIIPHVQPLARCIAPDLIGMGCSGKLKDSSYYFADHYRYLCAWIDALKLPKKINFVVHDWGSGLGFHWGNEHKDRVQSITFMEALVGPVMSWEKWPEEGRGMFQAMRSPAGEEMILKNNLFVEGVLPGFILRKLSDDEMANYRAPYLEEGESRMPMLTWPREIPIVGDGPANMLKIASAYNKWLRQSHDVPKLYVDADPGALLTPYNRIAAKDWPNIQTEVAKGSHFLQEDSPDEIGQAIAKFLKNSVFQK